MPLSITTRNSATRQGSNGARNLPQTKKTMTNLKKTTTWALAILMALTTTLASCGDSGDEPNYIEPVETPNYYVKYEFTSQNSHLYSRNITITTENGTQKIRIPETTKADWEGVYGPVKKGFLTSLDVSFDDYGTIWARISVCKGKEPFAVKAEGRGTATNNKTSVSLSYVIDF